MRFADKLIQLRKEKGLSQEDLADSLGVSRQAVSRWEQGNTFPDLPNLQKIVKVFGVSADYLICDDYREEGHNDNAPVSETDKPQSQFDFKANRFLFVGFIWLFAALCFPLSDFSFRPICCGGSTPPKACFPSL